MKTMIAIGVLTISFPCVAKERKVVVDLANFVFKAYEDGKVVRSGPASGGRRWCDDIKRRCKTPQGTFRVLSKKGRYYRSPLYPLFCSNKKGSKKLCAPMPFAIKFHVEGASLHASNDNWSKLKHQSHSCVHMKLNDIKFLNKEFVEVGKTRIIILPY